MRRDGGQSVVGCQMVIQWSDSLWQETCFIFGSLWPQCCTYTSLYSYIDKSFILSPSILYIKSSEPRLSINTQHFGPKRIM